MRPLPPQAPQGHCIPLRAAVLLLKSVERGVGWYDDERAQVRQLESIGPMMAQRLSEAGVGRLHVHSGKHACPMSSIKFPHDSQGR